MIGLAASTATVLFAQAAPVRPVWPWDGGPQVLTCNIVGTGGAVEDYVLTISDTHAFITGQAAGQAIRMEMFVPFQSLPPTVRNEGKVRRVQFPVGDQTALVRQLYQGDELRSTFLNIGSNATEGQQLTIDRNY